MIAAVGKFFSHSKGGCNKRVPSYDLSSRGGGWSGWEEGRGSADRQCFLSQ